MGFWTRLFSSPAPGSQAPDAQNSPPARSWPAALTIEGKHLRWGKGSGQRVDLSQFGDGEFALLLHGGPVAVGPGATRADFDRIEAVVVRELQSAAPAHGGLSNADPRYVRGMARLKMALSLAVRDGLDLNLAQKLVVQ
jgi:hypothetical protein